MAWMDAEFCESRCPVCTRFRSFWGTAMTPRTPSFFVETLLGFLTQRRRDAEFFESKSAVLLFHIERQSGAGRLAQCRNERLFIHP